MNSITIESLVQLLFWLLLGAALAGMLANWTRVPYAVLLVLGGLLVEESHLVTVPRLDPNIFLLLFLPPLLFDAAFRIDAKEIRSSWRSILILAVPGVLFGTVFTGVVVWQLVAISFPAALLFGSIVGATDPVAVTSVFRRLKAPGRLVALVEGESLVNDGMAVTLFTLTFGTTLSGQLEPVEAIRLFGWQVTGGVLAGGLAGLVFSRLTVTVDDHLVEMMLSIALAYGSFLMAQAIGASGPLACVVAGFIHGSYGRQIGMNVTTRGLLDNFWEYLGFLTNGLVFLSVGLSVSIAVLLTQLWPVTIAIASVSMGRILLIIGETVATPAKLRRDLASNVVLTWGGLRGALTITLALALPEDLPGRETIVAMAYGVVLFTLVVQGLTLGPLIGRVGLRLVESDYDS